MCAPSVPSHRPADQSPARAHRQAFCAIACVDRSVGYAPADRARQSSARRRAATQNPSEFMPRPSTIHLDADLPGRRRIQGLASQDALPDDTNSACHIRVRAICAVPQPIRFLSRRLPRSRVFAVTEATGGLTFRSDFRDRPPGQQILDPRARSPTTQRVRSSSPACSGSARSASQPRPATHDGHQACSEVTGEVMPIADSGSAPLTSPVPRSPRAGPRTSWAADARTLPGRSLPLRSAPSSPRAPRPRRPRR